MPQTARDRAGEADGTSSSCRVHQLGARSTRRPSRTTRMSTTVQAGTKLRDALGHQCGEISSATGRHPAHLATCSTPPRTLGVKNTRPARCSVWREDLRGRAGSFACATWASLNTATIAHQLLGRTSGSRAAADSPPRPSVRDLIHLAHSVPTASPRLSARCWPPLICPDVCTRRDRGTTPDRGAGLMTRPCLLDSLDLSE